MRRSRLLVGTIVLGVAVIGSGLFGGVSAWGSSSPKGGTIYVSATPKNGATDPIVIVGAIGDFGTATTIDQNGKVELQRRPVTPSTWIRDQYQDPQEGRGETRLLQR